MITYHELNSKSPEFPDAYAVISMDIEPEFVEPGEYVRERFRIQEEGAKTDDERRLIPEGYRIHMIAAKDNIPAKSQAPFIRTSSQRSAMKILVSPW